MIPPTPLESLQEPWSPFPPSPEQHTVVQGFGADPTSAIAASSTATVWLHTDRIDERDLPLAFTHLALEWGSATIPLATLERIPKVGRPVHVGLRLPAAPVQLDALLQMLHVVGVRTVAILAPDTWEDEKMALRMRFPALDVRRIGPPLR